MTIQTVQSALRLWRGQNQRGQNNNVDHHGADINFIHYLPPSVLGPVKKRRNDDILNAMTQEKTVTPLSAGGRDSFFPLINIYLYILTAYMLKNPIID